MAEPRYPSARSQRRRPGGHERNSLSFKRTTAQRTSAGLAIIAAAAIGLTACSGRRPPPRPTSTPPPPRAPRPSAVSTRLVAAAQAEGELNVIALPDNWANYGEIKALFEEKYGITVNSADPDISSAEEIAAADNLAGQDTAPDVFDLGTAVTLDSLDYFAPYQVANWDEIPAENKEATGLWVNDYTGSMSIGYDSNSVPEPTSLDDLLGDDYRGAVALNGDPTQAGAAFAAVGLATVQSGGTLDDFQPGIDFFEKLNDAGNFLPVNVTEATIAAGEIKVVVRLELQQPRGRLDASTAGRSPPSRARSTRASTTRPSTRTPRTRPPRACGRSSSTAPRRRTCSSSAAPTR